MLRQGDRGLVKIFAYEGKHKLSDRMESDAYIILDQANTNIFVFVVRKENGEGRKRTIHRNWLLPIGSAAMDKHISEERPTPKSKLRPRKNKILVPQPRTTRRGPSTKDPYPPASDTDIESDDESFVVMVLQLTEEIDINTDRDEIADGSVA